MRLFPDADLFRQIHNSPGRPPTSAVDSKTLVKHPPTRPRLSYVLLALPWLVAAVVAARITGVPVSNDYRSELSIVVAAIALLVAGGASLLMLPSTVDGRRRAIGYASSLLAPFAAVLAVQTNGPHSVAFVAA